MYYPPQPQQIYIQQTPPPVKNQGYKMASIILFVVGYLLKFLGVLTLGIVIGVVPLFLGVACDILAFIFLCLI